MTVFDMHAHCEYSPDSSATIDSMCKRAIELGRKGLAFTDHLDAFSKYPFLLAPHSRGIFAYDAAATKAAVLAAGQKYGDKLNVFYGVELGQPHHNPVLSEQFVAEMGLDVVVASVHCRYGGADYYWAEYEAEKAPFMAERYFDSILQMVRWGKFDILAHMDYMLRYTLRAGLSIKLETYREQVEAILFELVRRGIALEINTAGMRYHMGVGPAVWVFKRYKELGGKLITIGTDSHRPEHLESGVVEAAELAKEAGFTEAVYYKQRIPHFFKID